MAKIADVLRKRGGRRYGEDGSDVLSRYMVPITTTYNCFEVYLLPIYILFYNMYFKSLQHAAFIAATMCPIGTEVN